MEEEVNIATENVTFYNVKVAWDLPELIPEYIIVLLEKLEPGNPFYKDSFKIKIAGVSEKYCSNVLIKERVRNG